MKKLIQIAALLWLVSIAAAQQTVVSYDWQDLKSHHKLHGGEAVQLDGQAVLKIENTNDAPDRVQLLKIVKPPLSNTVYEITGRIKYDNVEGVGYLEMWNYFPPARPGMPVVRFFSRTLADSGKLQKITGTCDWRDFSLPFDPAGASGPPTRLEINLILPGRGTVYLTPIKLWRYPAGFSFFPPARAAGGAWWSLKSDSLIAFIGGPASGCLGALLGVLAGKGKARRFVLAIWRCCIAAGVLCLIAAFVAIKISQPDYVSATLLIYGIIYTTIFSTIWPVARRRYRELEIRRMASMDAMGQ